MIGVALGNGTSRPGNGYLTCGFPLDELKQYVDVTIGCNRVYEEYCPDYVVTLDRRMVNRVGRMERRFRWLYKDYHTFNLMLDGEPVTHFKNINGGWCNNSGIVAVWFLADKIECDTIYMPGFDFFRPCDPGPDGVNRNELYTGNYMWSPDLHAGFSHLFDLYPETRFIRPGKIEKDDEDFYANNLQRLEHQTEIFNAKSNMG